MERTVFIVPHTHWDREWYMPHELFRWRLTQMIDALLDHMEGHPEYTCFNLDGQTIVIDDYLALRPEARPRLQRLIEAGRILIGPWWVQPDEWLPSAESHVRNLQLGIREAERLGGCMMIGHCADQFGHIAQLPQLFAQLELTSACLWRGVGDEVPGWSFWWEAPDGTRLPVLYLRHSYSNGLNLPADADDLLSRVVQAERDRRDDEPALLMNGSDHTFFEPAVPGLVRRGLPGYRLQLGSLADYERAMFDAGIDEHVHRGELRSTNRSNILVGTLSARMNLKQRDFEVSAALEHYAEPLEMLAHRMAGYDGLAALKHAWRVFLENAPHDSICGCSIDQTHREMLPRYDRSEQLAVRVADEAVAALAPGLDTGDGALALYSPVAGQPAPFTATVPATWQGGALAWGNATVPLTYGPLQPADVLNDRTVSVATALAHLDAVERGTIDGRRVQHVALEEADGAWTLVTSVGDGFVKADTTGLRERLRALRAGDIRIRHVVQSQPTVDIAGVLPPSPTIGLRVLHRTPRLAPAGAALSVQDQGIANEFYGVSFQPDGLQAESLRTGATFAGLNAYQVEGDRGDEYNAGITGEIVEDRSPESLDVSSDAVRARLRYRTTLHVSGGLADNRRDREGRARIDVTTTVTLWAGLDRIDFEVEVDNTARDMRLRVIFPVPYSPARVATEAHFYVAERPPEAEAWNGRSAERPAATFPQKTFTALDGPGAGIAVFNRGLPEGEVIEQPGGSAYALTLLRAVGWLSRPDLDSREGGAGPTLRTFDSQVPGVHRFAYAWTAYTGAWKDASVLEMAHAFAFPPRAWHLAGWAGDAHELPVAAVAGAVPSALHRSHLDGVPIVRVYRASGESGTATFTVPGAGTRVERTNLLERQAEAVQCGSKDTWDAYLKPWQIATFRMPG